MSARLGRLAALWAAFVLTLAPEISQACSVCMSGREDENRLAFILTTIFLSVLPLAMIGGLGWYLRRRTRDVAEAELRARDTAFQGVPTPR